MVGCLVFCDVAEQLPAGDDLVCSLMPVLADLLAVQLGQQEQGARLYTHEAWQNRTQHLCCIAWQSWLPLWHLLLHIPRHVVPVYKGTAVQQRISGLMPVVVQQLSCLGIGHLCPMPLALLQSTEPVMQLWKSMQPVHRTCNAEHTNL